MSDLLEEAKRRGYTFSTLAEAAKDFPCMDDCEQRYGKWLCCRIRKAAAESPEKEERR